MQTYEAWQSGRPILSRLPEVYQDNAVSDWLTQYFDQFLVDTKATVDDFPRQLNPNTCDDRLLDSIAPLYGFSGEYWDKGWTIESKRLLLANAYSIVWAKRGTKESLGYVLTALNVKHEIWEGSPFILGSSQVSIDRLGTGAWIYKIMLPRRYSPNGTEFQLARRINRLFGNIWCDSEVTYRDLVVGVDFPTEDAGVDDSLDFASPDNSLYFFLGL